MSLDPYQPCPCGSGKKIKFCCSKDIISDLGKVLELLDADQRVACVTQIDKLIESKGQRAALMVLKADVQIELGQLDAAEKTVDALLSKQIDNPIALAQASVLLAAKGNVGDAVMKLQRAVELIDQEWPMAVYHAFGVMGRALMSQGNIMAARRHLLVQASLSNARDSRVMQMLARIQSSPDIPLLLKQDAPFAERPADASWAEDFDDAMQTAGRGAWMAAAEKLTMLAFRARREPAIFKNIAILRSWLADVEATVAAWRSFVEREGVPLDEAVEAEALAQLLDPNAAHDTVDVVSLTYDVGDTDSLMERLLSDRRVARMPIDPSQLADDDDQPPPKAAYWLLDKPVPETGEGITREAVPTVLGELYLFGKQTDRRARLEFTVPRKHDFDARKAVCSEVLDELATPTDAEEVVDEIDAVTSALTWNWRFPDDTPRDVREQLIAEQQRDVLLETWPEQPLGVLDGKTPAEAAADPAYHVRVLAAILLLELGTQAQSLPEIDFNELRARLKLPKRETIDPASVDVASLSVIQLSQLDIPKLSDDQLLVAYQRAGRIGAMHALQGLAAEVTARESLEGRVDKSETYELLAQTTRDSDQAIEFIHKACEAAVAQGQSRGPWLLAELRLRFERGLPDQIPHLIQQIQRKYINEPEVAQGLYQVLLQYGLITPDGKPATPRQAEPVGAAAAAPEPTGGIWTPDSAETSAGGEKKSKLWIPGMD